MGSVPYFLHFLLLSLAVLRQSPDPLQQRPNQSSNAADMAAFRERAATGEASPGIGSLLRLPLHPGAAASGTNSSIRPLRDMLVGEWDCRPVPIRGIGAICGSNRLFQVPSPLSRVHAVAVSRGAAESAEREAGHESSRVGNHSPNGDCPAYQPGVLFPPRLRVSA